jgi:hypothetical protein
MQCLFHSSSAIILHPFWPEHAGLFKMISKAKRLMPQREMEKNTPFSAQITVTHQTQGYNKNRPSHHMAWQ